MKLSKFNNFIPLPGDKVLAYNAFTRRYLIMPSSISYIVSNLREGDDFGNLSSSTLQCLTETGFIIKNDADELTVLDKDIINLDCDPSSYELTVNPTLDCNFRCWYCYEQHGKGTKLNNDILNRIKKHLNNTLQPPVEIFYLSFFGGEPLLQFEDVCKPLMEYSRSLCSERKIGLRIHFTSNSFLVTDSIIDFLKQYLCSFQITLDGGKEFHDKVRFTNDGKGSYDKILNNVKQLANNGIVITLRINYTLGNIHSTENIINDLLRSCICHPENILVNFQRVWQDFHNGGEELIKSLLNEFKRKLISNGMRFCIPDMLNPRTSSCYGDKVNSACINFDGDFYKCTARDFIKSNRCGYLDTEGKLIWDNGKEALWSTSKFMHPACRVCRIAPICLSGCRQKSIEGVKECDCPLCYDEKRKDGLILQQFELLYIN